MAKKEEKKEEAVVTFSVKQPTELERLQELYKELLERNIRSIGDLENQIARLQK